MSKFEEQKQDIIDFIVNGLIESNNGHNKAIMAVKFNQMMEQLKPEYPTCSTCEYSTPVFKFGNNELQCTKLNYDVADFDFGCIHHSELESKNE